MGHGSSKESTKAAFAENVPLVAPPQGLLGAIDTYASRDGKPVNWVLSWARPANLPKRAGKGDGEDDSDEDEDEASGPDSTDKGKSKKTQKENKGGWTKRRYYVSDAATGELVLTTRMRSHKALTEDIVIQDAHGRPLYRLVGKSSWKNSFPDYYAYRYKPEVYERFARGEDDKKLEGREYLDMGEEGAEASAETALFSITSRYRRRLKLNIQTKPLPGSSALPLAGDQKAGVGSGAAAASSGSVFIQLRTNGKLKPDGVIMMQQNGERVMTKKERLHAAKAENLGQAQGSSSGAPSSAPADDDDSLSKKSSSFSAKKLFGKKHKDGDEDDGSSDESDWDEYEEASDAREGMAALGGQPLLKLGMIRARRDASFVSRNFYPSYEMELAPNVDPTMICAACVVARIVFEYVLAASSSTAVVVT